MDYINGGELLFHLQNEGRFAEPRVRFYVAELILCLEYLHGKGIIYRDMKLVRSARARTVLNCF